MRTDARELLLSASAQDAAIGPQHERDAADQDRPRLPAILQCHLETEQSGNKASRPKAERCGAYTHPRGR